MSGYLNLTPQGPGEETSPAFWSMVWQYQVTLQALKTRNSSTSFFSLKNANFKFKSHSGARCGDVDQLGGGVWLPQS